MQIYASRGGKKWALSFDYKPGQADFLDWMSFLPSKLMKEIGPNPEALSTNP